MMPAEDAEQQSVDVEQAGDEHQREEARNDEVLDGIDAEHLQRVELLANLAGTQISGDRCAGDAREHDRVHERRELAYRREHEEATETIQRTEQRQEVRRLQTRSAVTERHGRDEQRKPAQPQREQELRYELPTVGIRRTQSRHDGLARQDHHVPHLLEQTPRWQECPISHAANHLIPLLG